MAPLPATHPGSGPRPSVRHFQLIACHILPNFLVESIPLCTTEMFLLFSPYCFWPAHPQHRDCFCRRSLSCPVKLPQVYRSVHPCSPVFVLPPASASWVVIAFTGTSSPFSGSTCLIPAAPPKLEAGFTLLSPASVVRVQGQQAFITTVCMPHSSKPQYLVLSVAQGEAESVL